LSTLIIYTDGGLKPGPIKGQGDGGVGIAICREDGIVLTKISRHYPGPVTNQQMELLAAIEALEFVNRLPSKPERVVVRSDSAYMVNCFKSEWWVNWVMRSNWTNSSKKPVENRDFWRRLLQCVRGTHDRVASMIGPSPWKKLKGADADMIKLASTGLNVSFEKVKGHSGDRLNDLADELATQGKNGLEQELHMMAPRATAAAAVTA